MGSGELRLIKVSRGYGMPEHGHSGAELTLVLRGSFHDEIGRFGGATSPTSTRASSTGPLLDLGQRLHLRDRQRAPERFHGLITRQWQRVRRF